MVQLLENLRVGFSERAVALGDFNPDAAKAFAEAAECIATAMSSHLEERLTIRDAALEYGWNLEALRQRLQKDYLAKKIDGIYKVTRRAMTEQVGRGRGPRLDAEKKAKPAKVNPQANLDPALRGALARALSGRNRN